MTTIPNSDFTLVNLKPVLLVDLQTTDPYSKSLLPFWSQSTFKPCPISDFKISSVYEVETRRSVPVSEYKQIFKLTETGTLEVTGFLNVVKNWQISITAMTNSTIALSLPSYAVDLSISATTPVPNTPPFLTDPLPATYSLPEITATSGVVTLVISEAVDGNIEDTITISVSNLDTSFMIYD